MAEPTIIIGDTKSILHRGPSSMKNIANWNQLDSDMLAHLLQVHAQIANSKWWHSKVSFSTQGCQLLDATFPAFEDFVYVAVYFRQLIAKKDNLLGDAVQRYLKFLDDPIRAVWIKEELNGFNFKIDGNCFTILREYRVRDLFDAFMYGAGLMHKSPRPGNDHRDRFLEIYDKKPRVHVLYALNTSLQQLLNHVTRVAAVIRQDLGHWLHTHNLPLPDVRWHDRLFEVSK